MFDFLGFFADAQPPADVGGGGEMLWLFVMFTAIIFFIWIFMMNPHKKQEQRLRQMLNSLEKNDRVMTVGGLIGTIHSIDKEQNEIVLKVDEANNTRIRFHLTSISTVFPKEGSGSK
jgi:preprotein translocase subunit YajC